MENSTNVAAPVKATWNVQKGKLKEQFNTLTDMDLRYENGKKN